jgi:competence protein ComEC
VSFRWLDAGLAAPCVLRIVAGDHVMLLTGGLDAVAQARLLERGSVMKSEVVVVPRHGSLAALNAQFVEATRPQAAIVVADGAVLAAVRERWQASGARWHATHACGAIQVNLFSNQTALVQAPFARGWRWPWRAVCPRQ